MTSTPEGVPSTPVAAPAVDVPLPDESIGAQLSNPDEYNGPIEPAEHAPVVDDSPTHPDLPPTGTNSVEMSDEDRRKAINEVYTKETTALREKYRDEFHANMRARLAQRGIDWSPRPNKEERAKAAARKSLEDAGLPVPDSLR